jgi:hypothetical protein
MVLSSICRNRGANLVPNVPIMQDADAENSANRFVDALASFLHASRSDSASVTLRSELAQARAAAERQLNTKQYGDAVFEAFKAASIPGFA